MEVPGSSALFWNVWGHRVATPLNLSLLQAMLTTDVMCLTEVTHMAMPYDPVPAVHTSTDPNEPPTVINGLEQLIEQFDAYYEIRYHAPRLDTWTCVMTHKSYDKIGFGSALLMKRELNVIAAGDELILVDDKKRARVLQWVVYEKAKHRYLVAHLHGVWLPENTKGDDPRRDKQSELVLQHLAGLRKKFAIEKVIFGGDLNLDHNTKALALLETNEPFGEPYVNQIKLRGITDTRTPRYRKHGEGVTRYADWVLTSSAVKVHEFTVDTENHASDHAPLLVHFS